MVGQGHRRRSPVSSRRPESGVPAAVRPRRDRRMAAHREAIVAATPMPEQDVADAEDVRDRHPRGIAKMSVRNGSAGSVTTMLFV